MASMKQVNPNADIIRKGQALQANINAAVGLEDVMKSNLGPRGTLKMLVGGSGDIKLTKDGSVLINEMQIQHPTAQLIARTAGAQDEITGDGTTSNILLTGELLKESARHVSEGLHPRIVTEGYLVGKSKALEVLEQMKKPVSPKDKELLVSVAKSVVGTKVRQSLAAQLAQDIVDAVLLVYGDDNSKPIDLFMVEIMHMIHKADSDSKLIRGMLLDHGSRHPDMPTRVKDAYILTLNVSLEYEKTEVNSSFFYSSAEQRAKMVEGERKFVDDRVKKLIEFKRKIVGNTNKGFVIINQKGIDPMALDMLAKDNILALRRAKRRNMERVTLACGGVAMNSLDDLTADCLGWAGSVYEQTLGEDKYTFIEDVKHPKSCTMLIKGPNDYTIAQVKEAIRDGLRAIKNAIEDKCIIPGAGAFELLASHKIKEYAATLQGRSRLAVGAYGEAILVVPKTLAENSGFDVQETMLKLQDEVKSGHVVGLDINTGDAIDPVMEGIYDSYRVKRQLLHSSAMNASQILLVDEVLRAGKKLQKVDPNGPVAAPGE